MSCNTLHEAASRFYEWGVDSDAKGSWLFMGGDNLSWCSGFVVGCAMASGNWLSTSLREHAKFRSVKSLVAAAKKRGDFYRDPEAVGDKWARCAGVLAVVRGQHHIGVVAMDEDTPSGEFGIIHGNSANNAIEKTSWKAKHIYGFIVVPEGGWHEDV